MITSRSFTIFFSFVVGLVLTGLLTLGFFVNEIMKPAGSSKTEETFIIEKGEGLQQISERLSQAGLISSKLSFEVYVWLRGWPTKLQAGEYILSRDLNIRELSAVLAVGRDATSETMITIIEGWTIKDIANYLEKQRVVSSSDFLSAVVRVSDHPTLSVLSERPSGVSLEGYLFPDSYRVFRGASSDEIITKMLSNFDNKFSPDLREAISRRGQTVFETLIMASILEKEIKKTEDLPVAAGVFYKRLKAGQMLQSDATLNYVLSENERQDRLNATNLKNQSLYNTYNHLGLPPGPIGNPGLAAIKAAVFPDTNSYWYFLTDKDGNTHFAKTFAEHSENRRLYLDVN